MGDSMREDGGEVISCAYTQIPRIRDGGLYCSLAFYIAFCVAP